MRRSTLWLTALYSGALWSQTPVITEVMPGTPYGSACGPGWIEVYNPGSDTCHLAGMHWVINGRMYTAAARDRIAPGHCSVLHTGGPGALPDPSISGGGMLLLAADGHTVLDHFTWPPLPPGISYGRPFGAAGGYLTHPSPGSVEAPERPLLGRSRAPVLRTWQGHLITDRVPDGRVHFSVDGSRPDSSSTVLDHPVPVDPGQVVRAVTYRRGKLTSPELVFRPLAGPRACLVVAPTDLYDPEEGIHTSGAHDNHSRKGKAWQRSGWWLAADSSVAWPVHIALAGSGSRGAPKKSLRIRPGSMDAPSTSVPWATTMPNGFTLRADATPHAFLRNRFMNTVAERAGSRVDIVDGPAMEIDLNGRYHGLFRMLPPKNEAWCAGLNGGKPVEMVRSPMSNTNAHFTAFREALSEGASVEELDRLADLGSLVDLVCFDLWSGRPDHDLNMRCWRPAAPNGRWRWLLYDHDLWAPPGDPTVQRMYTTEPDGSPWLAALLHHPELRGMLLGRITVLGATVLWPERATALIEQIHHGHEQALEADHALWVTKAPETPHPSSTLALIRQHVQRRPTAIMAQLARAADTRTVNMAVEVEPAGAAVISMDGTALTYGNIRFPAFAGVEHRFRVEAAPGMEFLGWEHDVPPHTAIAVDPGKQPRLKARLRPIAVSRQNGP